jgi:hypothetical protein
MAALTDREVNAALVAPRHTLGATSRRRVMRLMARVARGQERRVAVYLGYEDLGGESG